MHSVFGSQATRLRTHPDSSLCGWRRAEDEGLLGADEGRSQTTKESEEEVEWCEAVEGEGGEEEGRCADRDGEEGSEVDGCAKSVGSGTSEERDDKVSRSGGVIFRGEEGGDVEVAGRLEEEGGEEGEERD